MDGDRDNRLDLRFPHERLARRFAEYRAYTMLDIFGTVPSVPRDVAAQLAEYAEAKRRAAAEKQRLADEEAERQRQQQSGSGGSGGSPTPTTPTPTPTPPSAPPTQPVPTTPADQSQWWTVTGGGSAGFYGGIRFNEGAFLYHGPGTGGVGQYRIPVNASTPPTYGATGIYTPVSYSGGPTQYITPSSADGQRYPSFEWFGVFRHT
jgi:hypothetical protein